MPMALPLLAAGGSIFAGISAGGLIGGAMVAGGALTAIGAVTKNQKLMKIGGLVSLAGGVAGLATGAFAATAETLAQQTAQEGFRASELAATEATNAAMGGAAAGTESMGAGVGTSLSQPSGIVANALKANPAGGQPMSAPFGSPDSMQSAANLSGPAAGPGAVTPASTAAAPVAPGAANASTTIAPAVVPGQDVGTWGDRIGQVGDWMKRNKEIVNVGAGIVGGAMKNASEQDAMKARLDAEQAALDKRRAQLNASITPLRMPTYVPPGG